MGSCQAQAHTHLILIMTTTHALSLRKSGDPEPGTSWTRVCVKVVLPSSYRPWRRAYRTGTAPIRVGQSEQYPNKGRADRPMTPPTHAASCMCFAPAPEVLDPPPEASGSDVKGRHGRPPEAKESPARRAEERPRTRAAPAATQGGRGTSQAARSKHPHPSSGCCRWSAAAAP